jgi:regulator of replication initiation timing
MGGIDKMMYAKIAGVLVLLSSLLFLYFRYESLIEENATFKRENAEIKNTLAEIQNQQALNKASILTVYQQMSEARQETDKIRKTVSSGRLAKILKAKPSLLTKKMVSGTKQMFKEIEDVSNSID